MMMVHHFLKHHHYIVLDKRNFLKQLLHLSWATRLEKPGGVAAAWKEIVVAFSLAYCVQDFTSAAAAADKITF